MAKAIKKEKNITSQPKVVKESFPAQRDEIRVNLAIGTITLLLTVLFLYVLNYVIYTNYTPNIQAILDKVVPLTFAPEAAFKPEPVERMQYQLSLFCTPLFIFLAYTLANRVRNFFSNNLTSAYFVNIVGIVLFVLYIVNLLNQNLLYVIDPDNAAAYATNTFFFRNNIMGKFNLIIIFYCFCGYLFLLYRNAGETTLKKVIVNIVSYGLASIIILDMVFYNIFNLGSQGWDRIGETNPVFYSITQIYAGKTLLVDTNAQYGLYAWILNPVFKIIGLSISKISWVMAVLDGIAFSLFYLGIKRLIKQDIIALITFLCFVYWQYWNSHIPLEDTPRQYYQYCPIRFIFPSIAFFLIVVYQTSTERMKRFILPVLTLAVSFGVLWNVDTGLVTYGATFIALLFSTVDLKASLKDSIRKCIPYVAWMIGSLIFAIIVFLLSTKSHSGSWPDVQKFLAYQNVFYISGFFMLPMTFIHFWNLPVLVFLIAGIYCLNRVKKANSPDLPVIAFLFILGLGLFAYFQGRSYDLTIPGVMYPSIILLGYFCNKFVFKIEKNKIKFHESLIFFMILFMFLTDGAFSMIFYTPSIHTLSVNNVFAADKKKEELAEGRIGFVKKHVPVGDTVIILAKEFESYYYASGKYYNPLNLPSSTEVFFKTQFYSLLDTIAASRYPIIYDPMHPWLNQDTILETLSRFTVVNDITPDLTLLSLKPVKEIKPRLTFDANTVYHDYLGDFRKYKAQHAKLNLHESFTIELFVTVDSGKLTKDNWLFSSQSKTTPFCGVFMQQNGNDLNQYLFTYGNGTTWCAFPVFKLNYRIENHLLFKVDKNIITVFNNSVQVAQSNTNSSIKNSDGIFAVNPYFPGRIPEIGVTNH